MRRWLSRLCFSLIVIAGACAFEAWRGGHDAPKQTLLAMTAAVCFGLGVAGMRERHRIQVDESNRHE